VGPSARIWRPVQPVRRRLSWYEPAGDYPIHIIVKNGRVILLGVVDNESDKTVAGLRAREVQGTFDVENQLVVESARRSSE
jgi:osmotically-inducible protein OsmY